MERCRIVWMREQRLRHKDRVFGVVTDHPATEEKPVLPLAMPAALDALTGKAFCGQAQSISYGSAKQDANKSFAQLFLEWSAGHIG